RFYPPPAPSRHTGRLTRGARDACRLLRGNLPNAHTAQIFGREPVDRLPSTTRATAEFKRRFCPITISHARSRRFVARGPWKRRNMLKRLRPTRRPSAPTRRPELPHLPAESSRAIE